VWRVPSEGGAPEQVTTQGGAAPQISPDGKMLYYRRGSSSASSIYATPITGGPEHQVVEGVTAWGFDLHGREIFYLIRTDPTLPLAVELRANDLSTGRTRSIARFEADSVLGLTVSPDGKSALLGVYNAGADLMLIENFR
jgi:hypothetical protein